MWARDHHPRPSLVPEAPRRFLTFGEYPFGLSCLGYAHWPRNSRY